MTETTNMATALTTEMIVARLVQFGPSCIEKWRQKIDHRTGTQRPAREAVCVMQARICHDVLYRFGIESRPLFTISEAGNAAYVQWQHHGGAVSEAEWLVAYKLLYPPDSPWWRDAHTTFQTVCVVPALGQIVDLSCSLMRRPDHGIVPPRAIALPWNGTSARYEAPWGAVWYQRIPDDFPPPGYPPIPTVEEGDDWINGPHYSYATRTIARAIRTGHVGVRVRRGGMN